MRACYFPEANKTLGPPKGWDESKGVCHHLAVAMVPDTDSYYSISAWIPSKEDNEAILQGKQIYLQVWGGQPPVSVYTVSDEGIPNNLKDMFFTEIPKEDQFDHCKEIRFAVMGVFANDFSRYQDWVDAVLDKTNG